ncbi:AAA domain-containing protein [bacterium]|jgi:ATP-dependent Clp protease ATP-binding subunit ClpX|nr:AAA domain-containing protein [bacterium]
MTDIFDFYPEVSESDQSTNDTLESVVLETDPDQKETTLATPPKSFDELTKDLMAYLKQNPGEAVFSVASPVSESDEDEGPQIARKPLKPKRSVKDIQFNLKPKAVKAHLDRFIIKQGEAKKALSIAICDHFNHIKAAQEGTSVHYSKQNVIMVGPTGVGKTYLIKCIAELIGVPFVKSDATKFTETGYQGGDVEDLVRQVYAKADESVELAEYGIIYLDEIDKIAGAESKFGKDVSGRGVQTNLLKLMEETDVSIRPPWDINSQIKQMMTNQSEAPETISTKHILFIVSGAFHGLDDITRSRLEGSKFGFERSQRDVDEDEVTQSISTADFIKFGLEPEFVGRLPVRVACTSLKEDDLYTILTQSEGSLLHQFIDSFRLYGIDVLITDPALRKIAGLAHLENTGARGLGTIFEQLFREFKFELPSSNVRQFVITKEMIDTPDKVLSRLLKNPLPFEQDFSNELVRRFELSLADRFGIPIGFEKTMANRIIKEAHQEQLPINDICNRYISRIEFALRLLKNKPIKTKILIDEKIINSSEMTIESWATHHLKHTAKS